MAVKLNQPETARTAGPTVQSVERALDLLEILAREEGFVSAGQLAEAAALAPATVYRLLTVLGRRGYVRHSRSNRSFTLGPHALVLGEAARQMLGSWAEPVLAELASQTGETTNLAVLESHGIVYVAQVPSPKHRVRMFTVVGRLVPPHSTAVGKALLAFADRDDVLALLQRIGLPPRTERTITNVDAFLDLLAVVREQGYAVDDEEEEDGVRCVAKAVLVEGSAQAAISVSAPRGRLTDDDIPPTVAMIDRATQKLAGMLEQHDQVSFLPGSQR